MTRSDMRWRAEPEYARRFGDLPCHDYRHPLTVDKWNPYQHRCHTPMLDDRVFNGLNFMHGGVHTTPDFCFMGCLDAPEDIPMGSTLGVRTLGDYDREEYNRLPRECTDWRARYRAQIEVGKMLKQILEEANT